MNIKLNQPYKIARERLKRYTAHYKIPAAKALVVPLRKLDDEVACDVRWEDGRGRLHVLQNKVFVTENLVPVNALSELDLYELWEHYYGKDDVSMERKQQ
jgi:hypothetical protein